MAKLSTIPSNFLITDALYTGWNVFKAKWTFVLIAAVVMFLLQMLPGFLIGLTEDQLGSGGTAIINIAGIILNLIVSMGWIYIMMRLVRGEQAKLEDLFAKASLIIKYLAGVILYSLIVIVGLILLIVPGLIWAIKYAFTPYLIIDKGIGPIEALKASAKMTQGVKWEIVGFHLTVTIVNILGLLALGIGLLITTPVTSLAYIRVYERLLDKLD